MQEIRAVACNYRLSTPICPCGGKAFVLLINPGNGSDRIKILARSRGGRWVEKWEDARYLHNFRVVTVVEHQPRFDWIGFCGVAEDPRCAEWIAAMNSGGFYGAGRHIGVDSRARA